MQGYLNLFITEAISIDKTQSFHSTSCESACMLSYIHSSYMTTFYFLYVGKKRNGHSKPARATADGNGRQKISSEMLSRTVQGTIAGEI